MGFRRRYRYKPYICYRPKKEIEELRFLQKPEMSCVDDDDVNESRNPLPHQEDVIRFLHYQQNKKAQGTIIDLKMGLGKTFIVLRFFKEMLYGFKAFKLLFITKHDILEHINEEVKITLNNCIRSTVQVKSYREIQKQGFENNSCDILVLDESHDIYQKKKLTHALGLIPRSFVVLLTGSAGSQREVQKQWEMLVDIQAITSDAIVYHANVKLLENVIKTANEYNIRLEMNESQRVYYETEVIKLKSSKKIMKVNNMRSLRKQLSVWKIPYVRNILKDAISNRLKIVVFSEFSSVLLQLRLALPQTGVVICDGSVQANQRHKRLQEFRKIDNYILIASTNLFSHGIDLGFCNGLVYMEPPWKAFIQRQTNARIERLGQVSDQKILFVIFNNTLETKLLVSNKQPVFDI
jgi:SNF2 family DNA or RNA helicase